VAAQAAQQILDEKGTAADALIAGFLAAAAERPSVLFCPVQALLAGPGVGARAFDGRAREPGLGLPRPRGATPGQKVAPAALAAVPASLAMLALLHAHDGKTSFSRLVAPAVAIAEQIGAGPRGALLGRIGRRSASALRDAVTARPILAAVGRSEGGLVSEQDLSEVRPEGGVPHATEMGGRRALDVPWPALGGSHRIAEVIAVADARGVLAALSYSPDDEGLEVPELGVVLPRDATVVRRGIPRARPGEAIACPAPILLVLSDDRLIMALGVRAAAPVRTADLAPSWSKSNAAPKLLRSAQTAAGGEKGFAVLRSETAQVRKLVG
jgi:gamma-glutamyltranspeptidase/glutathione hydrolase